MALHPAEKYAQDVLKGKIKTGKLIHLAVERYYRDLKNAKAKRWKFDREAAQNHIDFMSMLKHYKGQNAGQNFTLLPHQQFQAWNLYGWFKKNGQRRFRTNYEEVARKNGKSTCSAGRADYRILVDEPSGAQVYCAATKENQANIIPNDAAGLLFGVPGLRDLVETKKVREHVTRVITKQDPVSYIRSIGRDSKTEDGRHASEIKIDEYHAWDSNYLLDVLEQSMKGRANPLTDITTTAGLPYVSGKEGPCFAFRKMCIEVLMQIKEDDSLFIMIHSMDEGDNWEESKNWYKPNPSLDQPGCVTLEDLENEYIAAKNQGQSKIVEFKTKSLNVWTDAPKVFIPDNDWKKNTHGFTDKDLVGKECYAGLDCAKRIDLNAFVLYFPDFAEVKGKKLHAILPYFWVPEDYVKNAKDRVDYSKWVADGFIKSTSGNFADYNTIEFDIRALIKTYRPKCIGFDVAYAGNIVTNLSDDGIPCIDIYQGNASLAEPMELFMGLAVGGMIEHFSNPVMRWMVSNVVPNINSAGLAKPDKAKSQNKIDGVSATLDAMKAAHLWKTKFATQTPGLIVV